MGFEQRIRLTSSNGRQYVGMASFAAGSEGGSFPPLQTMNGCPGPTSCGNGGSKQMPTAHGTLREGSGFEVGGEACCMRWDTGFCSRESVGLDGSGVRQVVAPSRVLLVVNELYSRL